MFNPINLSVALDPSQELSLDDLDLVLVGGANNVEPAQAAPGGRFHVEGQVDANVHCLRHRVPRRRVNDFLDQLAKPLEHAARVVRVDGRHSARVARVPRLQQLERGAIPELPDDDPVGTAAQGGVLLWWSW